MVVLPDCAIADVHVVAERLRSRLCEVLAGGSVPPFTVSVGLAAAEAGEAISEVIDRPHERCTVGALRAEVAGHDVSARAYDTGRFERSQISPAELQERATA